jgi:hypothetical protein
MHGGDDDNDYSGWTARGRAKAKRAQSASAGKARAAPNRRSVVELGNEPRQVLVGGTKQTLSNNQAILESMIKRAFNDRSFRDVKELYRRLDEEEDAGLAQPIQTLSPYMRRKALKVIKELILDVRSMIDELFDLGLIKLDEDGAVIVPIAVLERIRIARSG